MVDVHTAERHGVCPVCEGYCGNDEDDSCRCPGCQDGWVGDPASARAFYIAPEDYPGSWPSYLAVQAETDRTVLEDAGQLTIEAPTPEQT
jgi:hypothetical protein